MGAILAIAMKDLKELSRDRVGLFWCLGFPIIMAVFFGSIFSGDKTTARSLGVAVIDEDHSVMSREFVARLKTRETLFVEETSNTEGAMARVRRGRQVAAVRLLKGFGNGFPGFGDDPTTRIEVAMDPSRKAEAGFLQGMIVQSQFEAMRARMADRGFLKGRIADGRDALSSSTGVSPTQRLVVSRLLSSMDDYLTSADETTLSFGMGRGAGSGGARSDDTMGVATQPVARDFSGQPRSGFDITFPAGILWGLVGCASAFSLSLVMERRRGTYQRLRTAPIGPARIMAGKALACFVACMADIAVLLAIGVVFFHVRVGSFPLMAMAAAAASVCFVGVTLFVSVLGKTEAAVSGSSWALFIVMMMLGGGMIPLIVMPKWLLKASSVSPVKWAILAFEGAIWRDFSFGEMLLPCAITSAAGAALFVVGYLFFRRADKS